MHEAVDNAKWMRGFRMKFRPTLAQRRYLARAFGVGRFVWNWALSLKREAYQQEKKSLSEVAVPY
jgi:putative transposase